MLIPSTKETGEELLAACDGLTRTKQEFDAARNSLSEAMRFGNGGHKGKEAQGIASLQLTRDAYRNLLSAEARLQAAMRATSADQMFPPEVTLARIAAGEQLSEVAEQRQHFESNIDEIFDFDARCHNALAEAILAAAS